VFCDRLWCSATTFTLIEKPILNLSVDLMQPLLGTLGLLSVCFHLILELCNAILGLAEALLLIYHVRGARN